MKKHFVNADESTHLNGFQASSKPAPPLWLIVLGCGLLWQSFAADVFVAPHGDDSSPGTREAPFATLNRALEHLTAFDVPLDEQHRRRVETPTDIRRTHNAGIQTRRIERRLGDPKRGSDGVSHVGRIMRRSVRPRSGTPPSHALPAVRPSTRCVRR